MDTADPRTRAPIAGRRLWIAAVVVLAICIMAWCWCSCNERRYRNYLEGLWVADEAFCKESDLREMYLMVGERSGGKFPAYLVMTRGDDFLSNQGLDITLGASLSQWASAAKSPAGAYRVPAARFEYDVHPALPERLGMEWSLETGRLTLYDGDKVYAHLVKRFEEV